MRIKPTIDDLCKKHHNEDAHSRHVAVLALTLWDGTKDALSLPDELRPLLQAAALLHDIGYDRNPSGHQAESARLILRSGLDGLTNRQTEIVAAIVRLHGGALAAALADPLLADPDISAAAGLPGALLRISDGLDYSHCQNAAIRSLAMLPDRLVCTVSSRGYAGNLARATAKADLWQQVTGKEFVVVEPGKAGRSARFAGIVAPDNTMADAVRKLLLLHSRLFTDQRMGMLEGKAVEPLHDARLALRRYRVVLETFMPWCGGAGVNSLDRAIALLNRKLSPFRDEDVWRAFLAVRQQSPQFKKDRAFARFCAAQRPARNGSTPAIAAILDKDTCRALVRRMARIPRTRLAGFMADAPALVPFAARGLAAEYWAVASLPETAKDGDPEKVHALRKRCRTARYRAEFFAPLLGKQAGIFVALFRELSEVLGCLHDADCMTLRLSREPAKAAQPLIPLLETIKKQERAAFKKSIAALCAPAVADAAQTLWMAGTAAMPALYLARHATAADGGPDRLRALTGKGVAEAKILGKALGTLHCRPMVLASSPLVRAVSTADCLKDRLSFKEEIEETETLLPDANPDDTIAFLADSGAATMLCVGHEPHLDALAGALLHEGSAKNVALEKASVCCIVFPGGNVERGRGEAVWQFGRKKLQRLAERFAGS